MTDQIAATIGHNQPPLNERLKIDYEALFQRITELQALGATVPDKFSSDVEAGQAQDLVKAMRVAIKHADAARDAEKEPYAAAVTLINATFKIPMDALSKVQKAVMAKLDAYLEEKKERERLAREAEAERQREIAAAALQEAQAAEARRLEAQRQRENEERKAREAAAEAELQREAARQAEARAAAAKAEALRVAAQRDADEKRLHELQAERAEEERLAREARAAADRATIDRVTADAQAHMAKGEAREAAKEEHASLSQAVRADRRADRMDEKAAASDAELSRTRGELGTVGSLARRWTCRVTDYNLLPLDVLRPFIMRDALDAAVYRAMQTGVRDMPGVVFEEVSEARVV